MNARYALLSSAKARVSFAFLSVLMLLDGATTWAGMRSGYAREINPLAAAAISGLGVVAACALKVAFGVAMAFFLVHLSERGRTAAQRRAVRGLVISVTLVMCLVVAWNVMNLAAAGVL